MWWDLPTLWVHRQKAKLETPRSKEDVIKAWRPHLWWGATLHWRTPGGHHTILQLKKEVFGRLVTLSQPTQSLYLHFLAPGSLTSLQQLPLKKYHFYNRPGSRRVSPSPGKPLVPQAHIDKETEGQVHRRLPWVCFSKFN